MSPIVRRYVEAVLETADDTTTDGELVARFMAEAGASHQKAQEWVRYSPVYRGGKIWHLGRD